VPQPFIDGVTAGGGSIDGELTGVGIDLADRILAAAPAAEPFIGQIVDAIYQAFSLAIANALWLGVVGALASTIIVALFVPELTLRRTPGAAGRRPEPTVANIPVLE
jgi:hypothetical protein